MVRAETLAAIFAEQQRISLQLEDIEETVGKSRHVIAESRELIAQADRQLKSLSRGR